MRIVASLCLALFWSGAAAGAPAFKTGDDLIWLCETDGAICRQYIVGVIDGLVWADEWVGRIAFCLPPVTVREAGEVVSRYLDQHPEERRYGASTAIVRAMIAAYPCPDPPPAAPPGRR